MSCSKELCESGMLSMASDFFRRDRVAASDRPSMDYTKIDIFQLALQQKLYTIVKPRPATLNPFQNNYEYFLYRTEVQ